VAPGPSRNWWPRFEHDKNPTLEAPQRVQERPMERNVLEELSRGGCMTTRLSLGQAFVFPS